MIWKNTHLSVALEKSNHCKSNIFFISFRRDHDSSLTLVFSVDDTNLVSRLEILSNILGLKAKLICEIWDLICHKYNESSFNLNISDAALDAY